jgi:hypothetical protein
MVADESYLTHTLPVKTSYLIISKLITYVLWNISSIALIALSLICLDSNSGYSYSMFTDFFFQIKKLVNVNEALVVIYVVLLFVATLAAYNLFIFCAVGLGQLITKNKLLGSLLSGIILYIILQLLSAVVLMPFMLALNNQVQSDNSGVYISLAIVGLVFEILVSVVFFILANYIFCKKLNLE